MPDRADAEIGSGDSSLPDDPADRFARDDAEARKRLQTRFDVEFLDIPLAEALDFLTERTRARFTLDERALNVIGVSTDTPLTLRVESATAEQILRLALHRLEEELDYVVRDGEVVVSTPQALIETRVYDCRDLLRAGAGDAKAPLAPPAPETRSDAAASDAGLARVGPMGGFGPMAPGAGGGLEGPVPGDPAGGIPGMGPGFGGLPGFAGGAPAAAYPEDEFLEMLEATVTPDQWEVVGGAATARVFRGLLVARHTPRGHRELTKLLDELRAALKAK